jgi:hypothetical protein
LNHVLIISSALGASVKRLPSGRPAWLGYSGFDFGVIIVGIVCLVMWKSPNRAPVAATSLLSVTILAAAIFGVLF